ncbi:hypothetical protein N7462_008727 [Penicillium macrosclerotiorum]|uniref:uncharacterized protein n=1 Tax=Penicillium macrosclerotiorum TaxID=303699 RepID=UPI002549473A|nr:uncharacterized protein N7462_008727 [Penicillium macrosclerotiorum]KAJ5675830.1 hypothetical protein N7462_008727 [Penicillium macrosclerotiorum]
MSASPYARSPSGHPLPELNTQDPYLSAQSDPEETDFHASAIRLTPVNGSPHHSSSSFTSPSDGNEARRPSFQAQDFLAPGGNDYRDPSAGTSPADLNAYLAPSDVMVDYSNNGWQSAGHLSIATQSTVPTNAQWSSMTVDTSHFLSPEHSIPSPLSVPESVVAQARSPMMHGGFGQPLPSSTLTNPSYGPSQLTVSTDHVANNELKSASSRGRSPIVTIESVSRGDSPDAFAHERRPSRSLLSPNGLDDEDDEDDGDQLVSPKSTAPSPASNWVRNSTPGRQGLAPSARGDEYVTSPNDLQNQRDRDMKNEDISHWSHNVSAANSEAGDDTPTQSRRKSKPANRLRARSTGDRPLQREDYFNLQRGAKDQSAPGPGVMLHESSDDGIVSDDESDGSTAPDSLPALADERGIYDQSTPDIDSSLIENTPSENVYVFPWQDPPRDLTRRTERMQPGSSTAAMVAYEKRARELDAQSITATIDNNSIINFGLERLTLNSNAPKKRSSSIFKRSVQQAQSMLKRQASDLSLASVPSTAQPGGSEGPQRKDSGGSYRHRLSLSSKHGSHRQHIRSPSLTNALMSMTGQMAAVGGSHSVQAVSPNGELSPKLPTKLRGRSRSELPRPPTPGLMDLMTSHGGPPVASLSRYTQPDPDDEPARSKISAEIDVAGVEDEDDLDMADDKGLVMEFPPVSRLPVPTLEGFKAQIMQLNPRLDPALIHRFAHEQVRRYRKLVEYQQKHAAAVAKGSCKSGKFCFALGGQATLLQQRKTATDTESGQTQFRITDLSQGRDQSYVLGEGAVAAAQFPLASPCLLSPGSLLVKTFQKPSDWSKHIFEDVQPFTCTWPDCTEPKSFKRKADWVRHESERHRQLEWWTCSYAECSHTCVRKNNFIQHLVREHKMPEPKGKEMKGSTGVDGSSREFDRLWRMVEECRHETENTPAQEPCRFCGNNCGTWKKLTVHLGKHMEQLAMPVLALARQSCASPGQGQPVPGVVASGTADSLQLQLQQHLPASSPSLEDRSTAILMLTLPLRRLLLLQPVPMPRVLSRGRRTRPVTPLTPLPPATPTRFPF